MTEPNPNTFDLADLFSGKIYPKDSVSVYLDEEAGFELTRNAKELTEAARTNDEEAVERLQARHEDLTKRVEATKVTFHLTGASRADRKAIMDKVLEEHPLTYNFLGQPQRNDEAEEEHTNLRWALHIERIERADGSVVTAPTPDSIKIFRGNAPDHAVATIENRINALNDNVRNGFEAISQETGFLSQP